MSFDPGLMPHRPRRTPYAPLQSLQFEAANNQYATQTLPGAGNRQKFTASIWPKRTKLNAGGPNMAILGAGTGGADREIICIGNAGSEQLRYYSALTGTDVYTSMLVRDVTAFPHAVIAVDTTQPTAADRIKMYWNGVRITSFASTTYPAQNAQMEINAAVAHYISRWADSATDYFDGVWADFCFVDGYALDPTYFGEFNAFGQWVPKRPSVITWGAKGFYLDGEMSGTTILDKSGNGNDWTAVNGIVECLDVPGDKASANLGNYMRWSAIDAIFSYARATLTNAGLKATAGGAAWYGAKGSFSIRGSKHYVRYRCDGAYGASDYLRAGVVASVSGTYYWHNGGGVNPAGATVASYTTNDVLGFAIDANTGAVWGEKNGAWQNGATLSEIETGDTTHALWVIGAGQKITPFVGVHTSPSAFTLLAEPDDWGASAPAGFKPLCTAHLPTKTPQDPGAQITVVTALASDLQDAIASSMDQVDFVFGKDRENATNWSVRDSVRGLFKSLSSNTTDAEITLAPNSRIPIMTGPTSPSGIASATSEHASWPAWKAFNGADGSEIWETPVGSGFPQRLSYEFSTTPRLPVIKYAITPRGGLPTHWTFEGWNGSAWVVLDTQSGVTLTPGTRFEYPIVNTVSYKKYSLNISASSNTYVNIDFLELLTGEYHYTGGNRQSLVLGGLTHMTAPEIAALVTATGATITPSAIAYDATLGMAIITYTGNGAYPASIPHPLGQVPVAAITKRRDSAANWYINHTPYNANWGYHLYFDTSTGNGGGSPYTYTAEAAKISMASSSVANASGATYVIYLFCNTDAIKVGSYTGNGSTDGPFIDLGGAPLWVMGKRTDTAGYDWHIHDGARSPFNPVDKYLAANVSTGENIATTFDFCASGLKLRTDAPSRNASGGTYIYLAFIDRYFGGANVAQGRAR